MTRLQEEKDYWNKAALDPEVDEKYISNLTDGFDKALGKLEGNVLEIGCGVGRLMKPGFHGIDISEEMLKIAESRNPDCRFKLTDGRTIPSGDDSFDAVYCVLVFQHLPADAVSDYFSEAARVLKPGGVFSFQFIQGEEDEPFSHHHSGEFIKSLLDRNGFVIEESKIGLIHDSWSWVYAKKPEIGV